jgi:platelet-activating factor acetylhydrolase IB subunit beta/gamma
VGEFAELWPRRMKPILVLLIVVVSFPWAGRCAETPAGGWPLNEAETTHVLRPEHERRPGVAAKKHQPALWPVTPTAGHWGGAKWLEAQAKLVEHVQATRGPIDVLLVGDSITQQWGSVLDRKPLNAAWQKHFGCYPTVNLGMACDKTQNVLWRLDHGGVAGLQPRLVVLLIGNNNMFYPRETGVAAAVQGIKACVENLRAKFPEAERVVVTIFPAHAPGHAFYEDIKQTNAALRAMKLERDPKVHVIDPWPEMIEADGTLRRGLFHVDNIHLTQGDGYAFFVTQLQPVVARLLR